MTSPLPPGTAQMSREAQRKAPGAAPSLTEPAAAQDKLDNQRFEAHAGEFMLPTHTRPSLITPDEINEIKAGYTTGSGRLKVLERVTGIRLDWWNEEIGGGPAIDAISGVDRVKCEQWFKAHPPLLAASSPAATRQAPPNPIRAKDDPDKLIEANRKKFGEVSSQADVEKNGRIIAQGAADRAAHAAADKAIVDAEKPKPVEPVATAPLAPASWLGTHVEIDYTDTDGFTGKIVVFQGSQVAEISKLVKLAGAVSASLKQAGAKPVAVAGPVAVSGKAAKPMCPVHHKAMKQSRKPGTWFCPQKDSTTDEYCTEKFTEPA